MSRISAAAHHCYHSFPWGGSLFYYYSAAEDDFRWILQSKAPIHQYGGRPTQFYVRENHPLQNAINKCNKRHLISKQAAPKTSGLYFLIPQLSRLNLQWSIWRLLYWHQASSTSGLPHAALLVLTQVLQQPPLSPAHCACATSDRWSEDISGEKKVLLKGA